jgi:hypothetical protein
MKTTVRGRAGFTSAIICRNNLASSETRRIES